MTNKDKKFAKDINVPRKEPIMIDGIDVSECDHFREGYCHPGTGVCYKCDTNCQYAAFYLKEQLTRKTQECEDLKERKLKLELNETHNKNEIKKLKKRIRKDREFFKNKISSLTLARKQFLEALDHFNWQIDLVKNDRYRKALEEIEEIIKTPCTEDYVCYELSRCYDCIKTSILDIISKAKGEE